VNGDHHELQFDFYLEGRILKVSKILLKRNIMSHTLPVSTSVTSLAIDFIQSLFRPAPVLSRKAAAGDPRTLYQMTRGRDSVSPAVLRNLADQAAK
jgi:hypothetical protein